MIYDDGGIITDENKKRRIDRMPSSEEVNAAMLTLDNLTSDTCQNAPKRQASTGYVLIVDDNAINLRLLEKILKAEGYHTDTAMNGKEALEKVTRWFNLMWFIGKE